MSLNPGAVRKVLIVRFSSIGDIVLTTPVVRCLHIQRPDLELHYLTKPAFRSIVEPLEGIERVHLLDANWRKMVRSLRDEHFDLIVDLHNNMRSHRLSLELRVPTRRFRKLNFKKWLLVQFGINRLPAIHIAERYLETVRILGIEYDRKGLDFVIPRETTIPIPLPDKFIALALGAQHATKKLPLDKLTELCSLMDAPIVLLGGPEDHEIGETLEAEFPHVVNLAGHCSLAQSALVCSKSRVLITHDTGMMHIGASLHVPILSVWGNTVPELGMYPLEPEEGSEIFQVSGLSCRPCSKIGFDSCPKGHFKCMREQDLAALSRRAVFLLREQE
ncbi:MAG: glycosyltransferase family 9 protein [Flavobacteriales bacterium]|nr:glycosyltransferase family 9 protein [Flavobacteriales bacterium]